MTIYCTIQKNVVSIATLSADNFRIAFYSFRIMNTFYPLGIKGSRTGFTINLYSISERIVSPQDTFHIHKILTIMGSVDRRWGRGASHFSQKMVVNL